MPLTENVQISLYIKCFNRAKPNRMLADTFIFRRFGTRVDM